MLLTCLCFSNTSVYDKHTHTHAHKNWICSRFQSEFPISVGQRKENSEENAHPPAGPVVNAKYFLA